MQRFISLTKGFFIAGIFLLLISSCEQIIKVSLHDQQPMLVIEGYITPGLGPYTVKLSESQAYFDQSGFKGVENAVVQIDNLLVKETLVNKGSGVYTSGSALRGITGYPYKLNVTALGKNYSAQVMLPNPVPIDTVYFAPSINYKDSLNAFIEFIDPLNEENYYRLKLFRNRRMPADEYFLITDSGSDGQRLLVPVYSREFAPGDTVLVQMDNLERNTWLYFKGLSEIVEEGFNAQAPGNPPSNITGGALGYFGAWGVSRYRRIIPDNN
jgi:hypothetical protein